MSPCLIFLSFTVAGHTMDFSDGCVPSKIKQRNEDVSAPTSTLLDQSSVDDLGSQPATQPLTESQDSMSDDQASMTQDDKVILELSDGSLLTSIIT